MNRLRRGKIRKKKFNKVNEEKICALGTGSCLFLVEGNKSEEVFFLMLGFATFICSQTLQYQVVLAIM